jgi:ABC-type oligopeptide transport system substrate-binding subunit
MKKFRLVKKTRISLLLLISCFLIASFSINAKEIVVQLPFADNIPSFVPYYWQSQHVLAQGTIFEGLFGYAPDPSGLGGIKVVPVIADKWTVSPDGKVWTITLRKDKKWSNGDPITARDFEWTYKYECDPSIPDVPLWASHLQHVNNGWAVKGGGAPIDALGIKCTDDYTIVFTLQYPRYDFNCFLVTGGSMPLHRKTVEKWGPNEWWKPEHFVGNGPYIPQSWTQNKEAVLVKNKNYVGTCGNVDKFILKNYDGNASLVQPYQSGEIDLAWLKTVADYKVSTSKADLKAVYNETPSDLSWVGYALDRSLSPLFDDIRIRKAFALSLDRNTLCNTVLNGRAIPAASYWTPNDAIGKNLKPMPYDVAAAKKLLAEAGYPDGKGFPTIKFYITGNNQPEVEYMVDQWKKTLGVNILIENMESAAYNQFVWSSNWNANADPGFMRINASMNSFEITGLDKGSYHTQLAFDFPAASRKKDYDLEEQRKKFLSMDGGLKESDWEPLMAYRDKLNEAIKKIIAKEPNKHWINDEWMHKPDLLDQYKEAYDNWKAAKTDKEKTEQWRLVNRLLMNTERNVIEYNDLSDIGREAKRQFIYGMRYMTFDKAIAAAPKYLQITQDQYYLVPVYMEKIQYLMKKNITGLMVYKFAWGPLAFNLKYINVK